MGHLCEFTMAGEGASMAADQARTGAPARAYTPAAAGWALAGARWGPTALRIAPGAQLRRLRETSNITREEAAEAIRALYLDQPDSVIDYVTVMNQLCVQAETGAASKDMLGALLKQT